MIADKNLQLASALDATNCTNLGYQLTLDTIDATQLRDLGAGCQLFCQVTIRSNWTTDAAFGLTTFGLKADTVVRRSTAFDNLVYDHLIPYVGISEPIPTTTLTAGRVISFPINAQALNNVLPGLAAHDSRGMRYLFGSVNNLDVIVPNSPVGKAPTGGTYDMDIVAVTSNGVYVAGANKQSEAPFYPTAITQV